MSSLPTIHLFDKYADHEIRELEGKQLDVGWKPTVQVNTACRVEAGGKLLFDYLPGAVSPELSAALWPILSPIKVPTNQRATASGSYKRPLPTNPSGGGNSIMSATLGSTEGDAGGRNSYCRQTAFTKANADLFERQPIRDMFDVVTSAARKHERDRYNAQAEVALRLLPEWRILDLPFTTLTVNNNYSTGIHIDSGDLDAGVSCLLVLRRGKYDGAMLTFPQWSAGVDMQDGDLLLMDAHEWHANTPMVFLDDDAERVSVVFYLRERMEHCDTPEAEEEKHQEQLAQYRQEASI